MSTEKQTARPYQIQLFEIAREKNIIAYLPTGSGKTLVSILLLENFKSSVKKKVVSKHH
jgi:endoribonuclease Dicer